MIKLTQEDKRVLELVKLVQKDDILFMDASKGIIADHIKDIYGTDKKFLRNEYQLLAYGCALAVRIIEGELHLGTSSQEVQDQLEKMRFGIAVMWGTLIHESVERDKKVEEKTK